MMLHGARRLLVGLVVWALVAGGCTDPAVEGDAGETATPSEGAASKADELRLSLEGRFALHADLLAEAVRARSDDAHAAASAALQRNTRALAAVVADAYDSEASRAFTGVVEPLADELRSYAEQGAADGARPSATLRRVPRRAARFMADLTEGGMKRSRGQELAQRAIDSLVDAAGSRGDADGAYAAQRDAFVQMLDLGTAFAAGIADHQPERYGGPRSTGALELRSALRQFVGEHAVLAVGMTRAGSVGRRDFPAAGAALNGNTDDLVAALQASVATPVEEFAEAWRQRISSLADYTVAAATGQSSRLDVSFKALRRADRSIAALLDELTDGNVARRALRRALARLTAALVRQVDAFTEKRYAAAERAKVQAYDRSLHVADVIAMGIAAHRPDEFLRP